VLCDWISDVQDSSFIRILAILLLFGKRILPHLENRKKWQWLNGHRIEETREQVEKRTMGQNRRGQGNQKK
jgi:hypothetical protein